MAATQKEATPVKTFKYGNYVFNVCAETHIQKSVNGKDGAAMYSYYILQNGACAGIESAPLFKSATESEKQGVALLKELAAEGRFDD